MAVWSMIPDPRAFGRGFKAALAVCVCAAFLVACPPGADAQLIMNFPKQKAGTSATPSIAKRKPDPSSQMLVQAEEIQYDYTNERVLAAGRVQMHYAGSVLEANRVIYDQKTKRLRAEGNVRLTEADGKVLYSEALELSDDYRDGFVDSLRLEAPDKTRFAAARADRSAGTYTVFQSGVYTACEPCKDNPQRPPLWQVKAARIIHNEAEKMIYFEDARFEFFGYPIAYLPFMSAPDPTVKRKSGFLMPIFSNSGKYGVGVEIPYFWALAPNYDVTIAPRFTTKQGVLMQGEWRHRLMNGAYSINAAGIFQQDKDEFLRSGGVGTPGFTDFRGAIETKGLFELSDRFVWGWDGTVLSDKTFLQDYRLGRYSDPLAFQKDNTAAISQLFLSGRGDRSYFDIRGMYFYGFSEADSQTQLPVIHPVMDYSYVFGQPVFGGELAFNANLTSLSRREADYDPITQDALVSKMCDAPTADTAKRVNCVLRGIPGSYTRFSGEAQWRRTFTDPLGQVVTPFMSFRADVASLSVKGDPAVAQFIDAGEEQFARNMPTFGVEYRYPFISAHGWGTQTIEPIAQVVVRPNESRIGRMPNEDAQSLVYDDSNLFRVDKFSGWDRMEGGGRTNVGAQYTAQFNGAGMFNVLFGQSYHLFGKNSFATGDTANTGLDSGLETDRSDYVARATWQPSSIYALTTRYRFDEQSFEVRRFELEGRVNYDRWWGSLLYGNYDAQPLLGFLQRREGVLGTASVKVTQNWSVLGSARYDLDAGRIDQTVLGLGYIDDCFAIAVNYITDHTVSGNTQTDQKLMLQISLRTLGGTAFTQKVGTATTSNTSSLGIGY